MSYPLYEHMLRKARIESANIGQEFSALKRVYEALKAAYAQLQAENAELKKQLKI